MSRSSTGQICRRVLGWALQTRWVRRCRFSTATTTRTIWLALIVFLALPSLAHAEDKLFTAVRIGVWTTQAMDLSVTQRVLGAGTGREANTLMGWTMRDPYVAAATKVGGALAIDYLLRQAHRRNRMAAIWTGIGVTTAYSVVLVHNRRVMTAGEPGRR